MNPAAKIVQIRERLAALAERAPQRRDRFTAGARWSEEELARFEAEHGVVLPPGYRLYLREIGDGGAGFTWDGLRSLRDADDAQLAQLKRRSKLDEPLEPVPLPSPALDGWFLLGISPDHCDCYLVVNGSRAGEVWLDASGVEDGAIFPGEPADFLDRMLAWIGQAERELDQEEQDRALVADFEAGNAKATLETLDQPAREHAMAVLFEAGPGRMVELARSGQLEAVVALAERVLEIFPDAFHAWDPLAFACMKLAQEHGAARARELAAIFDPRLEQLFTWLRDPPRGRGATVLGILSNVTATLNYAERFHDTVRFLAEAHPSLQPFPYHNRINALLGLGAIDAAEEAVKEAVAREGVAAAYHLQLAKIAARRGDDEKAIAELATVKELGYATFAGLRAHRDLARMENVPAFRALFDA